MPAVVFDKCCGCVELKTGCYILGYIGLVVNLIAAVLTLIMVLGSAVVAADGKNDDEKTIGAGILIISCILLVGLVLNLAFITVLLVGLHKEKRGHLKAYLVYSMIYIILHTTMFFAKLTMGSLTPQLIFMEIFSLLLAVYFFMVIRSQYYAMSSDSSKGAIYRHA